MKKEKPNQKKENKEKPVMTEKVSDTDKKKEKRKVKEEILEVRPTSKSKKETNKQEEPPKSPQKKKKQTSLVAVALISFVLGGLATYLVLTNTSLLKTKPDEPLQGEVNQEIEEEAEEVAGQVESQTESILKDDFAIDEDEFYAENDHTSTDRKERFFSQMDKLQIKEDNVYESVETFDDIKEIKNFEAVLSIGSMEIIETDTDEITISSFYKCKDKGRKAPNYTVSGKTMSYEEPEDVYEKMFILVEMPEDLLINYNCAIDVGELYLFGLDANRLETQTNIGAVWLENIDASELRTSQQSGALHVKGISASVLKLDMTTGGTKIKEADIDRIFVNGNIGEIYLEDLEAQQVEISSSVGAVYLKNTEIMKANILTNTGAIEIDKPQTNKMSNYDIRSNLGAVTLHLDEESAYQYFGSIGIGKLTVNKEGEWIDKSLRNSIWRSENFESTEELIEFTVETGVGAQTIN